MDDLIEALKIFRKYTNSRNPTNCEHDVLYIMDVDPETVLEKDHKCLEELGFFVDGDIECYFSFRFGSA